MLIYTYILCSTAHFSKQYIAKIWRINRNTNEYIYLIFNCSTECSGCDVIFAGAGLIVICEGKHVRSPKVWYLSSTWRPCLVVSTLVQALGDLAWRWVHLCTQLVGLLGDFSLVQALWGLAWRCLHWCKLEALLWGASTWWPCLVVSAVVQALGGLVWRCLQWCKYLEALLGDVCGGACNFRPCLDVSAFKMY